MVVTVCGPTSRSLHRLTWPPPACVAHLTLLLSVHPGKYKPDEGAGSCLSCGSGKYNNDTASWSIGDCIPCLPGTWSGLEVRGKECETCEIGTIAPSSGYALCMQCVAGTQAVSATECAKCLVNEYTSTAGSTSCQACPDNQFNTENGSVSCTLCSGGEVSTS